MQILQNAIRIGIVRTDRLGDMVLTLPMVNVLKQINPKVKIIIFANSYVEPLLVNQLKIHSYIFIDKSNKPLNELYKEYKIDVIFFPRPKKEEISAANDAKIPLRVGSGYRLYSYLLNKRIYEHRKTGKKNEAEYNLGLISSLTGENFEVELLKPFISEKTINIVTEKLEKHGIKDFHHLVVMHPGGGDSAPKFPVEKFGELAKLISEKTKYQVLITGTAREEDLCKRVNEISPKGLNLCSSFDLYEIIALLNISTGIITNSTGVLHIAAALDKKIIGFYPNSPQMSPTRWGPMNKYNIILTPPKSAGNKQKDNLELISVEDAYAAFRSLFLFNSTIIL